MAQSRRPIPDFRLDDHLFFYFSQILARRTRDLNVQLKRYGLDYPRWRVLAVLHEHSGAGMGRLADLTSADRTTLTHTLRLMEAEGLVAKRERPSDRRHLEVSMTAKGRRLFARILPLALAETDRALSGFAASEIAALRNQLRRIANNLREEGFDAPRCPRHKNGVMDYDRAYANAPFIPGADAYPPRWEREAAAFRVGLGARARLGLAYGPGARQLLDLFEPETTPKGLLVFIHGGYWLRFGREMWSHLAAGALARGWACAMPSYTLAPQARIGEMTREIARAVEIASGLVPGPVVVAGHSAGGHLSARTGCDDLSIAAPVIRVVPISPLADLEPLELTAMNQSLRIDAAEIEAESPARKTLRTDVSAHVWVGASERPVFLYHARLLAEAWACPWTPAPNRHHFDVIEDLIDPSSALVSACLD